MKNMKLKISQVFRLLDSVCGICHVEIENCNFVVNCIWPRSMNSKEIQEWENLFRIASCREVTSEINDLNVKFFIDGNSFVKS